MAVLEAPGPLRFVSWAWVARNELAVHAQAPDELGGGVLEQDPVGVLLPTPALCTHSPS